MSKIIAFLLLSLGFASGANAQTLKAWTTAADSAYVDGDYYAAFKYYEIALEYDSTLTSLWYKYGESARQFQAFPYAEKAYRRVLAAPDSTAFPLASFQLANVLRQQGKYQEAVAFYQLFIDQYGATHASEAETARQSLQNSQWAADIVETGKSSGIKLLHFGEEINTPYSEFGASQQGDTILYSSYRFPYKKDKHNPSRLFIKVLRSEAAAPGVPLEAEGDFNADGQHTANTALSPDGKTLFYTMCEYIDVGKIRCDLYARDSEGGGAPRKLSINAENYTTTQPSIGIDPVSGSRFLFFSSDRPGGKGNLDLWRSELDDNGQPGQPVNLAAVNTAGNEATPFFHSRSRQLFFSSDGYQGLGGLDVYQTVMEDPAAWSTPSHLPYPINSSYNEIYFNLNETGSRALFSSDRYGSSFIEIDKEACCYDIYAYDLRIDLLALTFDQRTLTALAGATVELVEVTDDGQEIPVASLTNPAANDFNFPLEPYKRYRIKASKFGYSQAFEEIDLRNQHFFTSQTIERKLYLTPPELQVLTFNELDSTPLNGCTVKLFAFEGAQPVLLSERTNEEGYDYRYPLELNQTYIITAEKQGYESDRDTVIFTPEDIVRLGPLVTVPMYLKPTPPGFLPLALYFDNDRPDRRSRATVTNLTYGETYEEYMPRKEEFKATFTEGMSENDKFLTEQRYELFFERDVRGGYQDLLEFTQVLLVYLQQGNSIEIVLKGYASPRAGTDYNLILSKRRISSVRNHFYRYQDGVFAPFLENGQFKIAEQAFGESFAAKGVSDQMDDVKGSIYDIIASVERRVEIVEIKTGNAADEMTGSQE